MDRRDDRRDAPYDRRGPPPDRGGRRDSERRDNSFERREGRREGAERRDSDPRDKGEREKTLNERLKEMAGMKFDEPDQGDDIPPRRRLSDAKEDAPKDGGFRFEPPSNGNIFEPTPTNTI